jgi:hypothetical protein
MTKGGVDYVIKIGFFTSQRIQTAMHGEIPDWQFDDEFDGGKNTCSRVIRQLKTYNLP